MFRREESGYGSTESLLETSPPSPNWTRIAADAVRLQTEFEVTELLMNSANGIVYQGHCLATGQEVIFKQIPRTTVPNWMFHDGSLVPAEIAFHFAAFRLATNETICRPVAWLEKRSSFVLILEKLGGGNCMDLFELSKKYGAIAEEPVKIIFSQLVDMWASLNASGICHRDLKDENVIINSSTLECRLIDFGCATKLSPKDQKSFAGTPEFFPPEWFRQGSYTHHNLTAWSVGVILFILLTGKMPVQLKPNIVDFNLERDAYAHLTSLSSGAQNLLKALLENEPAKRADYARTRKLLQQWCC